MEQSRINEVILKLKEAKEIASLKDNPHRSNGNEMLIYLIGLALDEAEYREGTRPRR
ncbi:hypothetical protein [Rhizobium straminoryzae]|uniref:hypothetical protein n=1 Tax=Rhizobium straminoryzae TaxID=1387186 RepID=UPI00163D8135|nr:hypothetical protein [Rhizobium straminoryzae]